MGTYFGKRIFDLVASLLGLLVSAPLLLVIMLLVWLQDKHSPVYWGPRVGRSGRPFHIAKLRSMSMNADKTGVSSTSANDNRITPVGKFIRRYKLDELSQLWNVVRGEMSLVGPRPQIASDVAHYTSEEQDLLKARPGITDISSIVFSDEGSILADSDNADLDYAKLIRPWKIKLGLLYVRNASLLLDIRLCFITILAIINHQRALDAVQGILAELDCEDDLREVVKREKPLEPQPLPVSLAKEHGL